MNFSKPEENPENLHRPEERVARAYLQYLGFVQTGAVRTYRFRRIATGERSRECTVSADLGLFMRHHVELQDGPALCLLLLSQPLNTAGKPDRPTPDFLTDADLLDYLAQRHAPVEQNKYHLNEPRRLPVVHCK